jgi:hypothetical protein
LPEELGIAMKIKIAVLVFVFSAGMAFGYSPPLDDPSEEGQESDLAALARKEAERRESLSEKGVVITNVELSSLVGDMRSGQAEATVSPVTPDDGEESNASGSGAEPPAPVTDEKEAMLEQLREDLRAARQSVETASNSYMVLELRINSLRNRLYQEADPQRQQMLQQALDEATTDIAEVRSAEADARQALDQLRTEAQKAGMLPGEIRDIIGTVPVTRTSSTID